MKLNVVKKVSSIILLFSLLISGNGYVYDEQNVVEASDSLQNPTRSTDSDGNEVVTWDLVEFGHYWQNDTNQDGVANEEDDKEPLRWRVISVEHGFAILLSDNIIDCQPYNTTDSNVTWETCSLRKWLNETFINDAFSSEEISDISISLLANDNNPQRNTSGGNGTDDQVYCLSISDGLWTKYGFSSNYNDYDIARGAKVTSFAINKGCYSCPDGEYKGFGRWWLRSPGSDSKHAAYVSYSCWVGMSGILVGENYGVRPCISVPLSSSLLKHIGTTTSKGDSNTNGSEDGSSLAHFVTNINPADKSNRVNLDDPIIFTVPSGTKANASKITVYAGKEIISSGNYTITNSDLKVTITPNGYWRPNTSYSIVLGAGSFTDSRGITLKNESKYYFTTNYLYRNLEGVRVDESAVSKKYDTNFIFFSNKNIMPFPSENEDEFVKEFRIWANASGYGGSVSKLSDNEIKEILDEPLNNIVTDTDNNIYQLETDMTVYTAMRNILMVQYTQEYLKKEEDRLKTVASAEDLETSAKVLKDYYSRLQEYMGKEDGGEMLLPAVENILLNYSIYYYSREQDESIIDKDLKRLQGNYLNIETINGLLPDSIKEQIESSYGHSEEEIVAYSKKLINEIDHGKTIAYEIVKTADNLKSLKDATEVEGDDTILKLLDGAGESTRNLVIKPFFEVYHDQILAGIGIDAKSSSWMLAESSFKNISAVKNGISSNPILFYTNIFNKFIEFAEKSYESNKAYYPVWLLYTQYYMPNTAPDIYERIYGGHDTYILGYFDGLIDKETFSNESDPLIKLLEIPLYEENKAPSGIYSLLYAHQDTFLSGKEYKGDSIVQTAGMLSQIRRANQKEMAKTLISYALEKRASDKMKKSVEIIACPTDVIIRENNTNKVVFTIKNNMQAEKNTGVYGAYYLLGKDKDVKYIILNEGYYAEIKVVENGAMNYAYMETGEGSSDIALVYDNVNIQQGEILSTTEGKLEKKGTNEAVSPSAIYSVSQKKKISKSTDDGDNDKEENRTTVNQGESQTTNSNVKDTSDPTGGTVAAASSGGSAPSGFSAGGTSGSTASSEKESDDYETKTKITKHKDGSSRIKITEIYPKYKVIIILDKDKSGKITKAYATAAMDKSIMKNIDFAKLGKRIYKDAEKNDVILTITRENGKTKDGCCIKANTKVLRKSSSVKIKKEGKTVKASKIKDLGKRLSEIGQGDYDIVLKK